MVSREGIEPSCRRPPALVAALLESVWVAAGPLEQPPGTPHWNYHPQ
jgi:hypothetical protein